MAMGNPTHRPPSRNEPKPQTGEPDAPKYLSAKARKHWKRLVPMLLQMRVLTQADGDSLAKLCAKLADVEELETNIRKSGWLIKNPKTGAIHANPLVQIKLQQDKDLIVMFREFGLTPSARSRIQIAPEDKRASVIEKMTA
jgi:P27 family predicted phage terminase small subunit